MAQQEDKSNWLALWVGLAIVVVLVVVFSRPSESTAGDTIGSPQTVRNPVAVTFTSDPEGAQVYVDGRPRGVTPTTIELEAGEPTSYRIVTNEPYDDYDLYEPYSGTVTPTEDIAVDVWISRTTAEEQASQRAAAQERLQAEAERRAAEQAAAEERARERRIGNAILIIENWRWADSSNSYYRVEGLVTNRTSQPIRSILAEARFYDSDGNFVHADDALIDYNPLLPGQSSPFDIIVRKNPGFASAGLHFRTFGGQAIPAISREDIE